MFAHSLVLVAFGLDSVIELVSGSILLWRLMIQARGASLEQVEYEERRAAWVVAFELVALILYMVVGAGLSLFTQARSDTIPQSAAKGLASLETDGRCGCIPNARHE